jgi:cytochrome c oxidase subunit 2
MVMAMTTLSSAIDAAGRDAANIEHLWRIFVAVCTVVYLLVLGAASVALFRRRREGGSAGERSAKRAVTTASAITVLIMFGLLVASIVTGRSLAGISRPSVMIELTGHQWWWQVDYDHVEKNRRFATANEIYIPVGEPVRIKLRTSDVIHSFWVPALHGKRDLITGHDGEINLRADRAGTYRGQCAEFCGLQHAKMTLWVTALPAADFAKWAESQRSSARMPSTPEERKGEEVFLNASCPICHNIAGTDASGRTAPDLTHFGSRRTIAAGSLPNNRANLADWITDPQHVKPGSFMPHSTMERAELDALITYLESLR